MQARIFVLDAVEGSDFYKKVITLFPQAFIFLEDPADAPGSREGLSEGNGALGQASFGWSENADDPSFHAGQGTENMEKKQQHSKTAGEKHPSRSGSGGHGGVFNVRSLRGKTAG